MKGKWRPASCLLAALGTVAVTASAGQSTTPVRGLHDNSPTLIALQNATIVTQPGTRYEGATLVIEQGRIQAVNRNNRAPSGARIIDATGYTIYPGFIDPYSSYGVPEAGRSSNYARNEPAQYDNQRAGGNASNAAIHAEARWVDRFSADKNAARPYLEQGFTAVQSARLDGIFRGQATTVSLADDIPNHLIYRSVGQQFSSFNKGSSTQQYPNSLMGSIALIRQTLSDAAWYQSAQGRPLSGGGVLEYNAALDSLSSVSEHGVIFEATEEHDILRAASVFGEFDIPVTYLASGYEYARIDDVRSVQRPLIVPLNFPAAPDVGAQFAELDVSVADLRHWERAPGNPAVLAQAGVDFAFTLHGLDNQADFWRNIRKAIDHGLEPDQALAALTTHAARIAGIDDKAGRLQAGYKADFVVASGDLFSDGEIVSVWTQGRENQFKPMHPTRFTGEYQLTIGGQTYTLSLQQGASVRGTLTQGSSIDGDRETTIERVQSEAHSISFTANMSELNEEGVYRFTLAASQRNQLQGRVIDAAGREHPLIAERRGESSSSETTRREAGSPSYTSQLTFPNIGLGQNEAVEQQNLIIKNATIWTSGDAGVLEQADMIVRDGRIHRIGQNLSTPRGYLEIDGTDLHITPGIVDEHSHIAIARGVNEGTEAVTSETRIGDVVNPDDVHIYRSLAGGTTVAHLLHGSANPIGGIGQTIKLRWGENAEGLKFTETPPTIKMALGENVKQSNWGIHNHRYPQTRMGVAALIHDFFRTAQEYEQAHADYNNLSRRERNQVAPPRRDYRLDALLEILREERFIHAHSYVASEVLALIDVADELGFNIHTFTHILEGYKVADELAAHGAAASSFADWWAFKIEAFDAIPYNACVMMERGVLTSLNSDSNDLQRRMNIEAAKSVRYCGMEEDEALKMITLYPAMQLKIDEYVGSLEQGKHADFVIWNNHPLSSYAQVQQTWIEGRKYFDREQDIAQRNALEQEHQALIQQVLAEGSDARRGNRNGYKAEQPTWHCTTNHDVWSGFLFQSHQHGGHH